MKVFNLKFCFLMTALLMLVGCQSDPLDPVQEADTTSETTLDFSISEENAVTNLRGFLSSDGMSRSGDSLDIESVIPITVEIPESRSSIASPTTVAYAVNFTEQDGYAVVAADYRISTSILSVVETGTVTDSLLLLAKECIANKKIYSNDYPKDQPMYFNDPDIADETFFNPNASSFFDDSVQDVVVGNFCDDDSQDASTEGSKVNKYSKERILKYALPLAMTIEYALEEIKATGGGVNPDKPLVIKPVDPLPNEIDLEGWGAWPATYGSWEIVKIKHPLLTSFVRWDQGSPFNDLYPNRRKYILFGHSHKAPAGCFPLAVAKIMAYFKYPKSKYGNNFWESLQEYYPRNFTHPDGNANAARLLKNISQNSNCLYFYAGTFGFPSEMTSFLRGNGYQGAHNKSYSFDRVTDMLDNDRPLIIYAIPGINIFKSHAWNIDGYKIRKRTVTEYTINGSTSREEYSNMVHCDFGWGGKSNGYYESGIFNNKNAENEYDESKGDKFNFNHYLHLITYGTLNPAYM